MSKSGHIDYTCDICGRTEPAALGLERPGGWRCGFYCNDVGLLGRGQDGEPIYDVCDTCYPRVRREITEAMMTLAHKYRPDKCKAPEGK